MGCRSRHSCTHSLHCSLTLTTDYNFPRAAKIVTGQLLQKLELKQTDGRTRPIALPSPLTLSVIKSTCWPNHHTNNTDTKFYTDRDTGGPDSRPDERSVTSSQVTWRCGGLFTAHELNWTDLNWHKKSRPSYTCSLVTTILRIDWLQRNWERQCSVSSQHMYSTAAVHAVHGTNRQKMQRPIRSRSQAWRWHRGSSSSSTPGAWFTEYLTTILRLSYDNAKVTIDLRLTSNLQNISPADLWRCAVRRRHSWLTLRSQLTTRRRRRRLLHWSSRTEAQLSHAVTWSINFLWVQFQGLFVKRGVQPKCGVQDKKCGVQNSFLLKEIRKIIKTIATICQIFRMKCTKNQISLVGWAYSTPSDPLCWI